MNERLRATIEETINNLRSKTFVPPVQSLMDIDVYKLFMMQFIRHYYPTVEATFKLTVRDKSIKLWKYIDQDELRHSFDHMRSLSLRKTDRYYLRGMDLYDKYMFDEDFLSFLDGFRFPEYVIDHRDGVMDIQFPGLWSESSPWETGGMAVISELYYRGILKGLTDSQIRELYIVADNRLQNDLHRIKNNPLVRFADFGHRRRHSFLWQKYVIGEAKRILGDQFIGTSDVWMAAKFDLNVIGTNAHELPMVATAIAKSDDEMRQAQYQVLWQWQEMYGKGLRIILPDTYGSEQFFANAPKWLLEWGGQRQDSGDPITEVDRYKIWLASNGVDPNERASIPSDGHDVSSMISIASHYEGKHVKGFGFGTGFTNNFNGILPGNDDFRSFSMVIKAYLANGNPCVKLPNDISKATGDAFAKERYLKVFGRQNRVERPVLV